MQLHNDDDRWNVFINCPFDKKYEPIFHAIIFTIVRCGYIPRTALENSDSSEVRIQKIIKIIMECRCAIHDISRIELSQDNALPRFNMPLELGLFLGAKFCGSKNQKKKSCLILDSEPYRYQISLSDIAGQDIRAHNDQPEEAILHIRNWLSSYNKEVRYPGGKAIWSQYQLFRNELPEICNELKLSVEDLTFTDYSIAIYQWLKHEETKIRV